MRVERYQRLEAEDPYVAAQAAILSLFLTYVGVKDYYIKECDPINLAVCLTIATMAGAYVVVRIMLLWQAKNAEAEVRPPVPQLVRDRRPCIGCS